MKYVLLIIIFVILTINTPSCLAFSASADDIYRDLLKFENNGSLPDYIQDLKPEIITEENNYKPKQKLTHIQAVEEFEQEVTINENRMPIEQPSKSWNDIVKSIASGHPSVFDIDYIKVLTEKNDPKATELLAWMYAKGVGVKKDLKASWFLYMKSAALDVENAKENAQIIYKQMPTSVKNELLRF